MRISRLKIEIYFALALAVMGFALGAALHFAFGVQPTRSVASLDAKDSVNAYDVLPCPPENEYRAIAAQIHLEVPAGIDVCNDPNHGRLAKLFSLAANLDLRLPPDFLPTLQNDLGDTVGFLGRMSNKLAFDFNQQTTVAFNKVQEHSIYLGGIFFSDTPLEALGTLMHEARHSSPHDPGHVTCKLGDIPTAEGGCDRKFSGEEADAGAYSYGAAYSAALGLYAKGISRGDREFLLSDSLHTIGTRFNELPPTLAAAHDLVATLDDLGRVSLLQPLGGSKPLALPSLHEGEKVTRLEFNVRNNGLYLLTSEQRLFTWTPAAGFSRPFPALLADGAKILDTGRIPVPFENYPYTNFLFADGILRYVQYNAKSGQQQLATYPMRGVLQRSGNPPPLSRFFLGLGGRGLFLDQSGNLSIGAVFGGDPAFNPRADFNTPGPWVQGTGGVLSDTIYGVSSDGRLRHVLVDFAQASDDGAEPEEIFSWEEPRLQAPGAKKFQEGLYLRALLDGAGDLHFESSNGKRAFAVVGQHLRDFAIFRSHTAEILPAKAPGEACALHDRLREPWFGQEVGLDPAGFLTSAEDCRRLGAASYRALRLLTPMEGEPARFEAVTGAGQAEILRPYETK